MNSLEQRYRDAARLEELAERRRKLWTDSHPLERLNCTTPNGALEYGRCQGLEIAAEELRQLAEKEK